MQQIELDCVRVKLSLSRVGEKEASSSGPGRGVGFGFLASVGSFCYLPRRRRLLGPKLTWSDWEIQGEQTPSSYGKSPQSSAIGVWLRIERHSRTTAAAASHHLAAAD